MKSGLPQRRTRLSSGVIWRSAAASSAPEAIRVGMRPVRSPNRAGSVSRVVVTMSLGRRSSGRAATSSRARTASSIWRTESTSTTSFQAAQKASERSIEANGERPDPVARSHRVLPPGMRSGVRLPSAGPSSRTDCPGSSAVIFGESWPSLTAVMKNSSVGASGAEAME